MPKKSKSKDYVAHFKAAPPGWGCVPCGKAGKNVSATQLAVFGSGLIEGRCRKHGKGR